MFEDPPPSSLCARSKASQEGSHTFRELEKKQQELSDFELARSLQVFFLYIDRVLGSRVPKFASKFRVQVEEATQLFEHLIIFQKFVERGRQRK